MSKEWLQKYLTMKPEVSKIFDDLEAYHNFCRFELCEFNPAHLYDRNNVNYRAFLDSQRPKREFRKDFKPRGTQSYRTRNNEQNISH